MSIVREKRNQFDAFQRAMLREIVREIATSALKSKIPKSRIENFTDELTFSIASIIDGGRALDDDGCGAAPVLTFKTKSQPALIGGGGSSWMHEYAAGAVEKYFHPSEEAAGKWRLCMSFESPDLSSFGAAFVNADLGRSDESLLKFLEKEALKFGKSGASSKCITKGWVSSPEKKSVTLTLQELRDEGVTGATLFRRFKDAQKRLPRNFL